MVKLTLSMFVATLLTAQVIAYENWDIETRAISENDLVGREPSADEATVFVRNIEELFARQPVDLVRRFKFHITKAGLHKAFDIRTKVAGLFLRSDEGDLFAREDFELGAREQDHHRSKGHRYAQASDELVARELYDELYERDLEDALYTREFVGWDIDELD